MKCFRTKRIVAISILFALILVGCTSIIYMKNSNTISKAYILAFDSAWNMDKGLNSGMKYVSISTTFFKSLNESEKRKLYDYVEKKYKVTVLEMSKTELIWNGYAADGGWPDGVLIQFGDYPGYSETSDSISFYGQKWQSASGAIGFSFEAKKKNGIWKVISCKSTWIS